MPPHINNPETNRKTGSFYFQGLKPEAQHTRTIRGMLSWVYKPSDIPLGNWRQLSMLVAAITPN